MLIAIPVLLLGGLLCLLVWLALVPLLSRTGSSSNERPRTAEDALHRATCAPGGHSLGSKPGGKTMEFHVRDSLQRGGERLVLFDARCAMGGGQPGPRFASIARVQLLPDGGIEIGGRRV